MQFIHAIIVQPIIIIKVLLLKILEINTTTITTTITRCQEVKQDDTTSSLTSLNLIDSVVLDLLM